MIKNTLLLFVFLCAKSLIAQDVIVFDNGKIKDVKIEDVNESEFKIYYIKRKETVYVNIDKVIQYKWNDTWYSYDKKTKKIDSSKSSFYYMKRNAILQPSNFTYGRYSISATFSPVLNSSSYAFRTALVADNPRIRIEPEISVFDWLSIKFPIVVGLNTSQDYPQLNTYPGTSNQYYSSYNNGPGEIGSQRGVSFYYTIFNDLSVKPSYDGNNYWYSNYNQNNNPHGNELLYQFGVTPKFYPLGQTKNAFYISQSFNVGYGNKNRVDYYATFEPTKFYNGSIGDSVDTWSLVNENTVSYRDDYLYFRYEGMIGFNFNWTKSINFCLESGVSSVLRSPSTEDQIYIKSDAVFEPAGTRIYQGERVRNSAFPGHWINRFHLIYKFEGRRISEPKLFDQ